MRALYIRSPHRKPLLSAHGSTVQDQRDWSSLVGDVRKAPENAQRTSATLMGRTCSTRSAARLASASQSMRFSARQQGTTWQSLPRQCPAHRPTTPRRAGRRSHPGLFGSLSTTNYYVGFSGCAFRRGAVRAVPFRAPRQQKTG